MKRVIVASILSFVLLFAFGPIVTEVGAETMNFKLVTVSDTKKSHKTDQNRVTLSPHKCRRKCDEQATI